MEKGSGPVVDHTINISKYNTLAGSSYTKLPKELGNPEKHLINIQKFDDNQFFKWCLIQNLHPADYYPTRIWQADKIFKAELDFKDIKFPVKVRGILKIEKKNCINISIFGYKYKEKYPIYVSGNTRNIDFVIVRGKRQNTLWPYKRLLIHSCMIIY